MNLKYSMMIFVGLGFLSAFTCLAQPGANAREELARPYVGITSDGNVQAGLFKLEKTGVSTAMVADAAQVFLASLSPEQRDKTVFPVDDTEWRNWANIHRFTRQGVGLNEMTESQREQAYGLLRASLSAKGYETSRDIMRLNHHLGELVSNFDEYGEHLYWFTIMGEPSAEGPWGWQIDGHHLIINYFVLGDQIVMTPTFMGSEPVRAESGTYKGVAILEDEQDLGLAFMKSLPSAAQQTARIGNKEGRSENLAEMFKDNIIVPYEGLPASSLSNAQKDQLMEVIALYVNNMKEGHAGIKLEEVRAHLDETYFAWLGEVDDVSPFYYRIHSPVILIEFDHQGPIALDGSRQVPTRRHIHTVVRTPNGNDYGKDLLRQHYEAHKNDPDHGHNH